MQTDKMQSLVITNYHNRECKFESLMLMFKINGNVVQLQGVQAHDFFGGQHQILCIFGYCSRLGNKEAIGKHRRFGRYRRLGRHRR